ncbi:hypothetical protein Q2T46_10650 [Thermoanaerobacterium sp. CMT5567-10]|uniref:hypothetical protein n=1 Tax=Thermoanaerobacterium sp. CMT5567-10 TaxID=3061989 RepID=UPI00287FE4A3|nr:hypothetical protein [Thermoanaerobacterium sp. CMT5567-10]WKV08002.2 hypothetical protein Q2T46_10650 [Thermoanaerobacterium sp. CMT5567-10]
MSLLTGNFGIYGRANTLLVSNVIIYIPFLLLIPFYEKCNCRKPNIGMIKQAVEGL